MASINKVILVGNLGNDPEQRQFPSGGNVATISLATKERRKVNDQWTDFTEWHKVEFQNGLADVVCRYLKKGSPIYVEGSLRTRKWVDKNTQQERYATYIRAEVMQMLSTGQRHTDQGGSYGDYNPNA